MMKSKPDKNGWITVSKKNQRVKTIHTSPDQIKKPSGVKYYWDGFDINGEQVWYLDLGNGNIITKKDKKYDHLVGTYFPDIIL